MAAGALSGQPGCVSLEPGTMPAAPPLQAAKPRFRGVSHEIAAFVFPILGLVLVVVSPTAAIRWASVVYTLGVTAMYATKRATTVATGRTRRAFVCAEPTTR